MQVDSLGTGIPDAVEAAWCASAGVPDSMQANVVTVQDALDPGSYATLMAPAGINFANVRSEENPSPDDAAVNTEFGFGFLDFDLHGPLCRPACDHPVDSAGVGHRRHALLAATATRRMIRSPTGFPGATTHRPIPAP